MTPPLEHTTPSKQSPSVLVANTEPDLGAVISCYLQDQGWSVHHALDDGTSEVGNGFAPKLVVTELEGGEIDGFEFLASLSALAVRPRVLVLVPPAALATLSGPTLEELGIDAVLGKPCRLDELERQLKCLQPAAPSWADRLQTAAAAEGNP